MLPLLEDKAHVGFRLCLCAVTASFLHAHSGNGTLLINLNETCVQGNTSICEFNLSLDVDVTLAGSLLCDKECRFKMLTNLESFALQKTKCKGNRRTINGSLARYGNLTYAVACSAQSQMINFTVDFLSPPVPTYIKLNFDGLPTRKSVMEIIGRVKSCMNNSDVSVSASVSLPGFKDTGKFQCTQHVGQVLYGNLTQANFTWCNAHAEWEGIDEAHCHYGPTVSFVKELLSNGSDFDVLNICNVSDGYPKNSTTTLKVADLQEISNIKDGDIITPKHHGLKVHCFTANDFGSDTTENSTLNVTFGPYDVNTHFNCQDIYFGSSRRYHVYFQLHFTANPAQGRLHVTGLRAGMVANKSCDTSEVTVNCSVLLNNVTSNDAIIATYEQNGGNNTRLGTWNVTKHCVEVDRPTTVISTTSVQRTSLTTIVSSTTKGEGNLGPIIGAAVGGVLIIAIFVVIALFFRRRRKSGRHEVLSANIATAESSFSKMQDNGEWLEQTNIIYDTADLKSGGGTKEVVENVLYGTAVNAANYDSKTKKKESTAKRNTDSQDTLYSNVQKPGNKKKRGEDGGASNSGLQTEGAYAVLDKEKKKGKKRAEKNSGSENAGFSGDLQEDATYAVVDKKNKAKGKGDATNAALDKKNKKEAKKKEDATYAVVDKKNKKEGKGKEDSTYAVLDKNNKKNGKDRIAILKLGQQLRQQFQLC